MQAWLDGWWLRDFESGRQTHVGMRMVWSVVASSKVEGVITEARSVKHHDLLPRPVDDTERPAMLKRTRNTLNSAVL